MATLLQPLRSRDRISRVFFFGCALALLTIVSPREALAQTTTICKQTNPSPDVTVTWFTFTGANGWTAGSGQDFATLYPLPIQLQDGNCRTFIIAGNDQFNQFTETVPPGWTLTDITCTYSTSVVNIIGANPNSAFQPGDTTVTIDQNESNVTCTFVNQRSQTGSLSVTKVVSPDPLGIGNALQFPMTVTCTNPTGSHSLNVHGNTSTVPFSLPVGSNCSIAETQPPLPSGCTWLPPQFSPPPPIIIGTGMSNETVTNGYTCGPGVCPPGTVLKGRKCVRVIECRPPLVPNAAGKACACPPGTVQKGQECVRRVECNRPAFPNRAGTACICPRGMTADGEKCVPR